MKACKTCHIPKELSEYYKDTRSSMKDGYYADCKECVIKRVRKRQETQFFNIDKELRFYKY